jgi:hypothetical protein
VEVFSQIRDHFVSGRQYVRICNDLWGCQVRPLVSLYYAAFWNWLHSWS